MRVLHLSDPHFGCHDLKVSHALLRQISQNPTDVICFTGDLTQRATRPQFQLAREFIEQLPGPVLVTVGNHDIPLYAFWQRLLSPLGRYKAVLDRQAHATFVNDQVAILLLNSTRWYRHIQGSLDPSYLRKQLQELPDDRFRIVGFHHPMDCRLPSDEKNLLRGREEIAKVLSESRVRLVLSGHIHDPFVTSSTRRYPGLANPFQIVVAGTCISLRTRSGQNNSFHVVNVNQEGESVVERWDFNAASEKFERRT